MTPPWRALEVLIAQSSAAAMVLNGLLAGNDLGCLIGRLPLALKA